MLMMDKNNAQTPDLTQEWLADKGLVEWFRRLSD